LWRRPKGVVAGAVISTWAACTAQCPKSDEKTPFDRCWPGSPTAISPDRPGSSIPIATSSPATTRGSSSGTTASLRRRPHLIGGKKMQLMGYLEAATGAAAIERAMASSSRA
jgi:hypothetical protein